MFLEFNWSGVCMRITLEWTQRDVPTTKPMTTLKNEEEIVRKRNNITNVWLWIRRNQRVWRHHNGILIERLFNSHSSYRTKPIINSNFNQSQKLLLSKDTPMHMNNSDLFLNVHRLFCLFFFVAFLLIVNLCECSDKRKFVY